MKKFLLLLFVLFASTAVGKRSLVEEISSYEILEAYVFEILPNGVDYVVGVCPGQYDAESVAAVEAVYARFESLALGESNEDPLVVLEDFKAAMENLKMNEMREGYYYIQPHRQIPSGSGKHGLIFDDGGAIRAEEFTRPETLTVEAAKYVWYFKPAAETDVLDTFEEQKENAYYIQNYGTGKWATNELDLTSSSLERSFKTGDKPAAYVFEYLSVIPGTVYIYTHTVKGKCTGTDQCPYCAAWNLQNHGKHYILKWNARWDEGNMMFLYPVAQEEVDAIRDQVVQYDINERLKELIVAAKEIYNRGIAYEPAADCTRDDDFSNHGLLYYDESDATSNLTIVDANGNDAVHPADGAGLVGLLDNKPGTFAHTYWSGTAFPHYFDVDLGEGNELDAISLKMMRRTGTSVHNASFGFGEAKVFVRNTPDEEWMEAGNLVMNYNINLYQRAEDGSILTDEVTGEPKLMTWAHDNGENYVGIGAMGLGGKYRYIRIQHYKTLDTISGGARENTYFSAAELALFGATYSHEKSLNNIMPQHLVENIMNELAKAEAELAAGKGTEAQLAALKAAYEAYIAEFPESSRLIDALAAAMSVIANIDGAVDKTGDMGAGYYPLAAYERYTAVVAEVAASVKEVMTFSEIENAIAKLNAAKVALMKTLVMPEVGSYLQIRSASSNSSFTGGIVYPRSGNDKRGVTLGFSTRIGSDYDGYVDDFDIAGSVSSVWYVEEVKDNTMALRNVGTGLYLQATNPANNQYAVLNTEKAMIEVQADGLKRGGYFNFKMGVDTTSKKDLFMNAMGSKYLCGWHSAAGADNSSFSIETVDLSTYEQGAYTVKVGENTAQFVTLPIDAYYINTGAYAYEVAGYYAAEKKLYFLPIDDGTFIKAGTPMLVYAPEEVSAVTFYQENNIYAIDELTFGYDGKTAKGLVGTVLGQAIGEGYGYLTGFNSIAPTKDLASNGGSVSYFVPSFGAYVDGSGIPVLKENPGVDPEDPCTGFALDLESLAAVAPGGVAPDIPEEVFVTSVSIEAPKTKLEVGEVVTFKANVYPADATNPKVVWKSSNERVVKVSNSGVVTGVGVGTATITITSTDGTNLSHSSVVTVVKASVPGGDSMNTNPADYTNVMYAENLEVRSGSEFVLPIIMRNTEDIISYQLDLYLPDGVTVKTDADGELMVAENEDRIKRSHTVTADFLKDGSLRIVGYSSKNDAYLGTEGIMLYVTLVASENMSEGDYEISYKNIIMTKSDINSFFEVVHVKSTLSVYNYKLGDVNNDGRINVSDVSSVVAMLLQGDDMVYNPAADINVDRRINVSDVSGVVGLLMSGAMTNKLDVPAALPVMAAYNETATTSSVFIEPFQINPGEEKEILVNLNNPDLDVISFQFDLVLPEGIEVVYDEDYYLVDAGSRLRRSYVVESNKLANGAFRVLAYSTKNETIKGTSGDIVKITVKAADTLADGIYTLNFSETTLTNPDQQSVYTEDTSCAISVGNATGVQSVGTAVQRQTIYDLYGRPTDAKQRGIYIMNGKKIFVK